MIMLFNQPSTNVSVASPTPSLDVALISGSGILSNRADLTKAKQYKLV